MNPVVIKTEHRSGELIDVSVYPTPGRYRTVFNRHEPERILFPDMTLVGTRTSVHMFMRLYDGDLRAPNLTWLGRACLGDRAEQSLKEGKITYDEAFWMTGWGEENGRERTDAHEHIRMWHGHESLQYRRSVAWLIEDRWGWKIREGS